MKFKNENRLTMLYTEAAVIMASIVAFIIFLASILAHIYVVTALCGIVFVGYLVYYFRHEDEYERAYDVFRKTKRSILKDKYIVFSFDTFKSTYELMLTREEETGAKNPFDLSYYYPEYNETTVVFNDALDYIKYVNYESEIEYREKQKKINSNLDTKAYENLKDELHKESRRHESEYSKAMSKAREQVLKSSNTKETESEKEYTDYYKVSYSRWDSFNANRTELSVVFDKREQVEKLIDYLQGSKNHLYLHTALISEYEYPLDDADKVIEHEKATTSFVQPINKPKTYYKVSYTIPYYKDKVCKDYFPKQYDEQFVIFDSIKAADTALTFLDLSRFCSDYNMEEIHELPKGSKVMTYNEFGEHYHATMLYYIKHNMA